VKCSGVGLDKRVGPGGPAPQPQTKHKHTFKMHLPMWSVNSQENNGNCCHQIIYFTAIMHQTRCRQLGLRPRPCWWSTQRSPRLPSWILTVLFLRRGKRNKGKKRRGRKEADLPFTFLATPLMTCILIAFYFLITW